MKLLYALLLMVSAQAASTSELCIQKKKQYGKDFISCSEVDWGVKPISADYQPSNFAPMTAPPSQVNGYKNDFPGIKNTRFYHDQNDLPLASKFLSAVNANSKGAPEDQSLVKWLSKDWYNGLQPKTSAAGWEGKCATWSAWSLDPELQKLFSGMRDGILCNGVPFTKGELKEIVTSLYPEPSVDRKNFDKFYSGYLGANPDEVEDANVALSKLGMLGQGDLGPADVLQLAQSAKQSGKNMMMDRDPGSETWNQPIQKITDVAYSDESVNVWETLTSAEFTSSAGKPEQLKFLADLASVESELTQSLLKANPISQDQLCSLRKSLNEKCDDLTVKLSMSAQVDVINRLKESAYQKKVIQTKKDVSIVKHEMLVEYGVENSFASNAPDQSFVQSYQYSSVNSVNPDGSDGAVIRSQWSPPVHHLSEICSSPSLVEGRNKTVLTRGFDLNQKCSNGKPVNAALSGREYFTGAVPPHGFKTFSAKPGFSVAQTEQQKAYNKLLEFMSTCEKFDQGVDFLKNLDQSALNNVISSEESDRLAKDYANVKKLLDSSYLKSLLDNKYQGVQGVDSLKSKLKL